MTTAQQIRLAQVKQAKAEACSPESGVGVRPDPGERLRDDTQDGHRIDD